MNFRRATCALAMTVALSAAGASSAQGYAWAGGKYSSGQNDAAPSINNLAWAISTSPSGYLVGAGAHYPGGWTMYGNYAYSYGSVCHSYAQPNNWGAMLQNGGGYGTFTINASYGTTGHC